MVSDDVLAIGTIGSGCHCYQKSILGGFERTPDVLVGHFIVMENAEQLSLTFAALINWATTPMAINPVVNYTVAILVLVVVPNMAVLDADAIAVQASDVDDIQHVSILLYTINVVAMVSRMVSSVCASKIAPVRTMVVTLIGKAMVDAAYKMLDFYTPSYAWSPTTFDPCIISDLDLPDVIGEPVSAPYLPEHIPVSNPMVVTYGFTVVPSTSTSGSIVIYLDAPVSIIALAIRVGYAPGVDADCAIGYVPVMVNVTPNGSDVTSPAPTLVAYSAMAVNSTASSMVFAISVTTYEPRCSMRSIS